MSKIPYEDTPSCEPKRRGRKPGSKNKLGHHAGRPSNGNGHQHGAAVPKRAEQGRSDHPPTRKDLGRPISCRIAYDTPVPCTDGHNCPGSSGSEIKICKSLTSPQTKPLPLPHGNDSMIRAVAQSGLNPDLITPEQLLLEIQKIATFEIGELFDDRGAPLPLNKLSKKAAAVISSYSASPLTYEGTVLIDPRDPEGKTPLYKINVSLWSKTAAQDQLNRYHGLYAKDKTPVNAQFNQFNQMNINSGWDLSRLSVEELELMLALRAKAGCEVVELERLGGEGL